jgi:hypothetical protein
MGVSCHCKRHLVCMWCSEDWHRIWVVQPCRRNLPSPFSGCRMNKRTDEGSSRFLRNVADYLPDYTAEGRRARTQVCNGILNTLRLNDIVVTVWACIWIEWPICQPKRKYLLHFIVSNEAWVRQEVSVPFLRTIQFHHKTVQLFFSSLPLSRLCSFEKTV